MLETYRQLPTWFRATLGVALIAAGFILAWSSHRQYLTAQEEAQRTGKQNHPLSDRNARSGFQSGLGLTFVGCIVVMTSGKSRAEKHGYRF